MDVNAISLFFPDLRSEKMHICFAAWLAFVCAVDNTLEGFHHEMPKKHLRIPERWYEILTASLSRVSDWDRTKKPFIESFAGNTQNPAHASPSFSAADAQIH